MRRGYVDIGSAARPCQLHYRSLGSGPPLVMLHASPMSSAALAPLMQAVADHVTAIAPDTPGYGLSDALDDDRGDLTPYVDALERFRERLGLARIGVYGSATGAQIGIEYARAHPERVTCLVLDNAAHFTDAERETITAGYFPDLAPDASAAHLVRIWTMAREQLMFFPWFMHGPETRLPAAGADTAIVHAIAMAYLYAGPGYDRAYRAAFANEDRDRLAGITVPVTILRWQGSILKPYTDRFDERDWAENFDMVPAGPTPAERAAVLGSVVARRAGGADVVPAAVTAPGDDDGHGDGDAPRRGFIDTGAGQLHALAAGSADAPRLILLHDIGASIDAVAGLVRQAAASHRVLAPELPGHGESAPAAGDIQAAARLLAPLCGDAPALVVGCGASAALALALGAMLGATRIALLNPVDGAGLPPGFDIDSLAPDLTPRADGGHLLAAWFMLGDAQRFLPFHARNPAHALSVQHEDDAATLTARLFDRLRCRDYGAMLGSALGVALEKSIAATPGDTRVALTPGSAAGAIAQHTLAPATLERAGSFDNEPAALSYLLEH